MSTPSHQLHWSTLACGTHPRVLDVNTNKHILCVTIVYVYCEHGWKWSMYINRKQTFMRKKRQHHSSCAYLWLRIYEYKLKNIKTKTKLCWTPPSQWYPFSWHVRLGRDPRTHTDTQRWEEGLFDKLTKASRGFLISGMGQLGIGSWRLTQLPRFTEK